MNKILDKISGSRAPSPPKVFDHLLLTSPRNNFREYLQMHENSIFGYCYFFSKINSSWSHIDARDSRYKKSDSRHRGGVLCGNVTFIITD